MDQSIVPAPPTVPAVFDQTTRLSVRQRKRWMEIIFSFDAKNTYVVYNDMGEPIFNVEEQGAGFGNFLKRVFMGPLRPFTVHVEELATQKDSLVLRRPFRFFFHRLEVRDTQGNPLGALQRKWTWLRRKYLVEGPDGQEVACLFGPILKPWTFQVRLPGSEETVGVVQKKWSGLAKEMFTEADNFWVEMANVHDRQLRALLFSATVLIDIVHFERKN